MDQRSTFWLAAAALLLAVVALPVGIVAVVKASDSGQSSSSDGGMAMGGAGSMSRHMAPAPMQGVPDATANVGGRAVPYRVKNGVRVYALTAKPVRWEILPGVHVTAWAYNGTVPGPQIRVPYGQRVRIVVKNELPEPTTVHWHGIAVPNAMDGVPGVTQKPIPSGGSFTYEFRAIPAGRDSKGGTFFYHSHYDEDRQVGLGLSGALIIDPPSAARYDVERTLAINEWSLDPMSGATRPPMEMEGMLPNYFTLNGKSFPSTETIHVRRGGRVLLRLIGAGQFVHPMHLHGTDFQIVAKDGHPLAQPISADVVQVAPGERYDLAFTATEPGKWAFHCHIGHHLTNNGESPGGLMLIVDVV
jgi:FtsP/CotA-like multicopper oxidase with cupredoxin domain